MGGEPAGSGGPQGSRTHPGLRQAPAERARRLPDAQRGRRRALCRQGPQPEEAGEQLCAGARPLEPHRAHGPRDCAYGIRDDADGDRGAAARSKPHQAPAPALQRASARRQVLPLYRRHRRYACAGALQASWGAQPQGRLFRPLRLGRSSRTHDQLAAARLSSQNLHRQCLRNTHAPLSALSDQALFRAVHERGQRCGLRGTGQRSQGFSLRQEPGGEGDHCLRHGRGFGEPRFRACRALPRPAGRAEPRPEPPGHQSGRRRGSGRLRHPSRRRHLLHPGVFLPDGAELGQSRLFSESRSFDSPCRGAQRVSCAVL